ncbi:hypothetical protein KI387_022974, partial [Taxus chinensis]
MDMERGEDGEILNISCPLITETSRHEGSVLVVVISTSVVVMGSLNFGFGVGFSSPSESGIIEELGLSIAQYSVFGSLLTVGAMIGALMSGYIADYLGFESVFIVLSSWMAYHSFVKGCYTIGYCKVDGWIWSWAYFLYSACIHSRNISHKLERRTYNNKPGPNQIQHYFKAIRDSNLCITISQLFVTIGTLTVYLLGMLLNWRIVALIGIIPSIILAMGLFLIPESPRWLAKVGRDKDFKEALQALRGKQYDVTHEATEIMVYVEELESLPKARISDLFQRSHAPAVIVGVGLMVLQQLGGINGIIFYASAIFKAAGYSSGQMASVGIAILQVPMTAVGALLMDKSGRRPLLMIAAGGMSVSCFVVGLSFYILGHSHQSALKLLGSRLALIGLLAYIGTFSLGMGGIPWIIMSEIFPINMKGIAGSLVSLTAWLGGLVVTVTFNFLLSWSATASFFIFCGVCAFTVVFVAKLVPETKGRTLEEIQSSFKGVCSIQVIPCANCWSHAMHQYGFSMFHDLF